MTQWTQERMDAKITQVVERLESHYWGSIVYEIIYAAAEYWHGFDVDDFCVNLICEDAIVFGSINRLIWSAKTGFRPDPQFCTEDFLRRCAAFGWLPR